MAGATVGSLFATQSERIEEIINKNVDVLLPSTDPVWMQNIVTSQGVGSADALGRDMQIVRVFQGGLTGVLEQGAPRDSMALFGDDQDTLIRAGRLHKMGIANTFPDPTEGPNQTPYRFICPMESMVANIMFTLGELQAEANVAVIGDIVAPKLEGFSRNIAVTLCNYWYVNENSNYQLSNLGATTGTTGTGAWTQIGSTDAWVFSFQPTNEATHRYHVGMRVDIYNAAGTNRRNDAAVYVTDVDHLSNTIELTAVTPDTGSWVSTSVCDTSDIVVLRNTKSATTQGTSVEFDATNQRGIAGVNSWLRGGGDVDGNGSDFILGNAKAGNTTTGTSDIDVNVKSEHKSAFFNQAGGVLTEHTMRQYLRRFHAAKDPYGYYIDTLIASDGVWLSYDSTKIARETLERTGRLGGATTEGYNSDRNFGGFQFSMDGRTYKGYTSCYVEDGSVYGIRMGGNNWKRYVPADVRNTKPNNKVAPFIPFRFVAGALTGLSTNQLPIFDSSGSTTRVTEGS